MQVIDFGGRVLILNIGLLSLKKYNFKNYKNKF